MCWPHFYQAGGILSEHRVALQQPGSVRSLPSEISVNLVPVCLCDSLCVWAALGCIWASLATLAIPRYLAVVHKRLHCLGKASGDL